MKTIEQVREMEGLKSDVRNVLTQTSYIQEQQDKQDKTLGVLIHSLDDLAKELRASIFSAESLRKDISIVADKLIGIEQKVNSHAEIINNIKFATSTVKWIGLKDVIIIGAIIISYFIK